MDAGGNIGTVRKSEAGSLLLIRNADFAPNYPNPMKTCMNSAVSPYHLKLW